MSALHVPYKHAVCNNPPPFPPYDKFTPILHFYSLSFVAPFSSFTPDEWEAYSSENIAKAERERKASVALRSEINGILMQTYVDLRNIFETVNNEFTKRIEESLSAKRSLEKELARVRF